MTVTVVEESDLHIGVPSCQRWGGCPAGCAEATHSAEYLKGCGCTWAGLLCGECVAAFQRYSHRKHPKWACLRCGCYYEGDHFAFLSVVPL